MVAFYWSLPPCLLFMEKKKELKWISVTSQEHLQHMKKYLSFEQN